MAERLVSRILQSAPLGKWWMRVLLIWAVTRLITTGLFLILATTQGPTYWTGPNPSYLDFLNIWDSEWFSKIYRDGFGGSEGYLSNLPLDEAGNVVQNSWAFMPGFPFLIRLLDFGAGWALVSSTASLILGFVLALLAYRVFSKRFDSNTSLWAVAWLGLCAPSIIFQAGYADTLGLVFLAAALLLVLEARYLLAILPIFALSLTRPGVVAFSLAMVLLWLLRFWQSRRHGLEFTRDERLQLGALGVVSFGLGWLWSAIAWLVTGRADAYLATELSWRVGFIGESRLVPFEGWSVSPAYFWGKQWGPVLMLALVLAAVALLFTPQVRQLGSALWLWVASFYLYLLLVFFPQSSTFRIMLMVFPLFGAFSALLMKAPTWVRWAGVPVFVLLQWWWLWVCWRYDAPDYSPP